MPQGRGDLSGCGAHDQTVGQCAGEANPATQRGSTGGTDTSSASGRAARPRFATIVADPPWRYVIGKHSGMRGTAESHYDTMGYGEILSLPVAELAQDNAHLYLWVTNPLLTEQRTEGISGADVVRAWGFEPKTVLTWAKSQIGLGFFFRGQTEHVIFGVRGHLPIPESSRESNLIQAPRRAHSQKPEAFYDLVERVSPGPYLEMFSRRARLGWETWGAEALGGTELVA